MDADSPISEASPEVSPHRTAPSVAERTVALTEVILCSDYPTQFALNATFLALGFHAQGPEGLNFGFVMALSLCDTVFLVGLIVLFLIAHGESPSEVFFGGKPFAPEVRVGIPLISSPLPLPWSCLWESAPWRRGYIRLSTIRYRI